MATPVTMPQLGETVVEGTITKWLKQEGDQVDADESLLEISTDKVDTEVPSPASGTLTQILVQEGETVDVGTKLAVIGGDGASAEPKPDVPEPATAPAAAGPTRCLGARLEAGTEATRASCFSGPDDRVPSARASGRGVFDPEDERVDVRHNGRHIIRCPTGARDLPRVIAALDESGARPVRRLAAV